MGIFTKIFVVLVMILSVLLVGLTVAFVVNVDTYKDKWASADTQRKTAELNLQLREADNLSAVQAALGERESLQAQIQAGQSQINQLTQTTLAQQGRVVELEANNAGVQTELARLGASAQKNTEINATLQVEVRDLRDKNISFQTRNIELSKELAERNTEVATLERQVRLQQENLKELEDQNAQLAGGVSTRGSAAPSQPGPGGAMNKLERGIVPDHPIRGLVTDARDINGHLFITVNVGTNDGVREGMEFMVHSGDKFLGNAIVTVVDLNSAAGRVTLQEADIQPNEAQVLAGGQP